MVLMDLLVVMMETPVWCLGLVWFAWWLTRPYCKDAAVWWDAHRPKCLVARRWRMLKRKKGWG